MGGQVSLPLVSLISAFVVVVLVFEQGAYWGLSNDLEE